MRARTAGAGMILMLASLAAPVLASEPLPRIPADIPGAPKEQTDFTRGVIRGATKGDFCARFQTMPGFTSWAGKVRDVQTSTVNGSIDISFSVGGAYRFEQVMQTSNPLYPAISKLKVGQMVRISGRFLHGNAECDYQLIDIGIALARIVVER